MKFNKIIKKTLSISLSLAFLLTAFQMTNIYAAGINIKDDFSQVFYNTNGIAGYSLDNVDDRVQVLDIDGDFKKDLLITRLGSNHVTLAKSTGDGKFTELYSGDALAGYDISDVNSRLLILDYNKDMRDDIFAYVPGKREVSLVSWDETSKRFIVSPHFQDRITFDMSNSNTRVFKYDFNGDGRDDIMSVEPSSGIKIALSLNDDTFSDHYTGSIDGFIPTSSDKIEVMDYDGDGIKDIVIYRPGEGKVMIAKFDNLATPYGFAAVYNKSYSNNGLAGFAMNNLNDQLKVFDYNGDGKDDIIMYSPSMETVVVARSNGDGSFMSVYNGKGIAGFDMKDSRDELKPFDFNGDGKDDIVMYRPGYGAVYIGKSEGYGTFSNVKASMGMGSFDMTDSIDSLIPMDYNGDGNDDVFMYRPGFGIAALDRSMPLIDGDSCENIAYIAHIQTPGTNDCSDIADSFLDYAQENGYKYIQFDMDNFYLYRSEWNNGTYNYSSSAELYNNLKTFYEKLDARNLRPIVTFSLSPSNRSWEATNSNLKNNTLTNETRAMVPLAPSNGSDEGFDKSVESCVGIAFKAMKDSSCKEKTIDFIHFGFDEFYGAENDHYFDGQMFTAATSTLDKEWLKNYVKNNSTTYENAYYELYASAMACCVKIVQKKANEYNQKTKAIFYSDMFDPQGNGNAQRINNSLGHSAWALDSAGNESEVKLDTSNVLKRQTLKEVKDSMVLNSWWYTNSYERRKYDLETTLRYYKTEGYKVILGSAYDERTNHNNTNLYDATRQMTKQNVNLSFKNEFKNTVIGLAAFNWPCGTNIGGTNNYWSTTPRSICLDIIPEMIKMTPVGPFAAPDQSQILTGDVNGDGLTDNVSIMENGVYVSLGISIGKYSSWILWSSEFGSDLGWTKELSAKLLKDVNSDGKMDVVAATDKYLYVGRSNGNSFVFERLGENIALNKTATASISHPSCPADKAFDGRIAVYNEKWCSGDNAGANSWLSVDLGSWERIKSWMVIHSSGSAGETNGYKTKSFKLQYSYDNVNWMDLDSVSDNTDGVTYRIINPIYLRYFRLYITEADADNVARIYELKLFNN